MICYNKDCSHYFAGKCQHITVIRKEMICLSIMNKSK
jgi:hypothetical protein